MSYHDLLYKYGSEQDSAETRIYIYAENPKRLRKPEEVASRDQTAEQYIKRLEQLIADLKDYRQALTARYAELETMAYTQVLKLQRHKYYRGSVEYKITITKKMEDGTETQELKEVYNGRERRKAFDRYEELKRQRPGITFEIDIEKARWET